MSFLRGHYHKLHGIPEHLKKHLSESRKGDKNPNYKGGIYFDKHNGRWMIRCRNGHCDQFAVAVARTKYGRFPKANELVHHDDEDKTNDSPENISIMTRSAHAKLHTDRNPIPKTKETSRKGGLIGGQTTKERFGIEHYKRISRLGAEVRRRKKEVN